MASKRGASGDAAKDVARCNVLCRPTQHVVLTFPPRFFGSRFMGFLRANRARFNHQARKGDSFLLKEVQMPLSNQLIIKCDSI